MMTDRSPNARRDPPARSRALLWFQPRTGLSVLYTTTHSSVIASGTFIY
jgi:hypothetical protein